MHFRRDLFLTFAAVASGEPIGDVHVHVFMRYYTAPDEPTEKKNFKRKTLRKMLQTYANDPQVNRLYQTYRRKVGKKKAEEWPDHEAKAFLRELDSLIDLSILLEDSPLVAFSFESAKDEKNPTVFDKKHGSKSWYIQLTTAGKAVADTQLGDIVLTAGDVVLAQPRVPLKFTRASDSALWRHCSIYFQPQPHWHQWLNWGGSQNAFMLVHTPADDRRKLETVFEELIDSMGTESELRYALHVNLLEQILLRCYELASPHEKMIDPRVAIAKNFLLAHLNESVQIDEIAQLAGLSHSRLRALFHDNIGMSMMEWRDHQRVIAAIKLLRDSTLSIAEIAQRVGYNDPLYFSRIFRRHMQVPPSALRVAKGAQKRSSA